MLFSDLMRVLWISSARDEGRDSWMYKVIRTKGRDVLSPKQVTYTILYEAQRILQKNGEPENREKGIFWVRRSHPITGSSQPQMPSLALHNKGPLTARCDGGA